MKFRYSVLIYVLLILILSLAACAVAEQPNNPVTPAPTEEPWTFPLSKEIMDDPEGFLTLVNVEHKLPESFKPKNLMNITIRASKDTVMQMRKPAHDALKLMFASALKDGIKLYAHSCYRTFHTQDVMYNNRLKEIGYDDKYVTQAGASDHQTGLGIDVISAKWIGKKLNADFYNTKEAKWMEAHCAEYGFIIRYPADKENVTNIRYEPWHLRYVGVEAATYMTDNGLTLEEFWDQWNGYLDGTWRPEGVGVVTDNADESNGGMVVMDDLISGN